MISGPAGTGKTTLAHALARAVGCPAVCRDEIKEGMVHAASAAGAGTGGFEAAPGDELTVRTFGVFFSVLRVLVDAGVTVVAEAAFQDQVWRPNLAPLLGSARLVVVQCEADPAVARRRVVDRLGSRPAHADATVAEDRMYFDDFRRLAVDAPTIEVDTTSGYDPDLDRVVAFVNRYGDGAGG